MVYHFFIISILIFVVSCQNIVAMEPQGGRKGKKALVLSSRRARQAAVTIDEKNWRDEESYEQECSGPVDQKFIEEKPLIHVITPGELLCASGVLSYEQLERIREKYKVRTVITLDQNPVQDLVGALQGLSIRSQNEVSYESINIPLPKGLIKKKHVEKLYEIFSDDKNYPRPILVCCSDGGGKVGFAAALWLMKKNKPLNVALRLLMIVEGYDFRDLAKMSFLDLISIDEKLRRQAKIFMLKHIANKRMKWDDESCKRLHGRYVRAHRAYTFDSRVCCCTCDLCCYCCCHSCLYKFFLCCSEFYVDLRIWGYEPSYPACPCDAC